MPGEFTLPCGTPARFELLSFGIYDVRQGEAQDAPRTASGVYRVQSGFELVRQTDVIEAAPARVFGLGFRIVGDRTAGDVPMDWVTRFPDGGITNAAGERFMRDEMACEVPLGAVTYRSYSFDEPWEMVPGVWVFEFRCDGQRIAEQRFTVTLPRAG
jgi:hypothetical protein